MQIRCMRFPSVERNYDAIVFSVHSHVAHAGNVQQWLSQFTNAFVAIFAFGRD